VGQPVEQRRGHLGIAEDARPFTEGEVGGDDHRAALVEPADEVEEQLTACLGEGQITKLIEDHEVETAATVGEAALVSVVGFAVELIDQAAGAGADAGASDADSEVSLAGAGRSSDIVPGIKKTKRSSAIAFIHAMANVLLLQAATGMAAKSF
jgi:hypothetical protein